MKKIALFAAAAVAMSIGSSEAITEGPSYNWGLMSDATSPAYGKAWERICTYKEYISESGTAARYHTVRIPSETKCPFAMTVEN